MKKSLCTLFALAALMAAFQTRALAQTENPNQLATTLAQSQAEPQTDIQPAESQPQTDPQTPEEILERMGKVMEDGKDKGFAMSMDMKIPILGTLRSRSRVLGDKMRVEGEMMGKKTVTYTDGKTQWTYDDENKTLTIENEKASAEKKDNGNAEMLNNVTDGYDVSLKKETADAWYFLCKKSRDNKEKDDPKTMDIVVAKGTFWPVSLSTKMKGVTVTMYDFSFGIKEEEVTFRPDLFPNATVVDKR